jgi:hypothetical protein
MNQKLPYLPLSFTGNPKALTAIPFVGSIQWLRRAFCLYVWLRLAGFLGLWSLRQVLLLYDFATWRGLLVRDDQLTGWVPDKCSSPGRALV